MNHIVQAWKDAAYRQSLSAEEQAMLLANPAGEIELTDAQLEAVFGADGGEGKNKIDQSNTQISTNSGNSIGNGLATLPLLNGNNIVIPIGERNSTPVCNQSNTPQAYPVNY